jgi:hypothetical protein
MFGYNSKVSDFKTFCERNQFFVVKTTHNSFESKSIWTQKNQKLIFTMELCFVHLNSHLMVFDVQTNKRKLTITWKKPIWGCNREYIYNRSKEGSSPARCIRIYITQKSSMKIWNKQNSDKGAYLLEVFFFPVSPTLHTYLVAQSN